MESLQLELLAEIKSLAIATRQLTLAVKEMENTKLTTLETKELPMFLRNQSQ